MKTMRQHLNRLERKLSKYPEEKRRFTSGKGSRRPVLELASDIVFEEFSEDINEVQKKYDVIIEWDAHSLFEERIPLIKVTISPEHPFFKEHLEKVGSGWHVLAPTNSVEKGTPIVRLYSKREDKQDRTALIASRFQVQYVGYLDMTLEDIILERLQSYWKKMVESIKEAKSIEEVETTLYAAAGREEFLRLMTLREGLFGSAARTNHFYTNCTSSWDKEKWERSIFNLDYVSKIASLLPTAERYLAEVSKKEPTNGAKQKQNH